MGGGLFYGKNRGIEGKGHETYSENMLQYLI
jgi:hypothetical protein